MKNLLIVGLILFIISCKNDPGNIAVQYQSHTIPVIYFTALPTEDTLFFTGFGDFYHHVESYGLQNRQDYQPRGYFSIGNNCTGGFSIYDLQSTFELPASLEKAAIHCLKAQDATLQNASYRQKDSLQITTLHPELYTSIQSIPVFIK